MSAEWSDAELVRSARGGNVEAFGVLFERHKGLVYHSLWSEIQDADAAEEFTAEAFRRAYQKLPEQRKEIENFGGWVYTIARNAFRSDWRKRRREVELDEDEDEELSERLADLSMDGQPEDVTREGDIARLVWDAMAFLPERYRLVMALNVRAGLKPGEVARQMGVARERVDTLLSRGRGLLEENVTLLVVSRVGRRACPQLDELLGRLDLRRATESQRRGLLRHIETCPRCQETRRRSVSAAELLALTPTLPLPESLTLLRVLGGVKGAGKVGWVVKGTAREGARAGVEAASKGLAVKAVIGVTVVATMVTTGVLVGRSRVAPPAAKTLNANAIESAIFKLLDVPAYTIVETREDQNGLVGQDAAQVITSTVSGGNYGCLNEIVGLGRIESYLIDGQIYSDGGLGYTRREPAEGERTNRGCLMDIEELTNDLLLSQDVEEEHYQWVGREEVAGRKAEHYRAEAEGAFVLQYTIAGAAIEFELADLDCTGAEDLWVDEKDGFLLQYTAEILCRTADGHDWRTQQRIAVTDVGRARAISLPEGAAGE